MTEEKPLTEQEIVPNSNYKDKYVHLIGQDAALEAAKMTVSNKTYGYGKTSHMIRTGICSLNFVISVPSATKEDQRSIEQTMAAFRQRKSKRHNINLAKTASTTSHTLFVRIDTLVLPHEKL